MNYVNWDLVLEITSNRLLDYYLSIPDNSWLIQYVKNVREQEKG